MLCKTHDLGSAYGQLDCYVLDKKISITQAKLRPAIIICPGGAYLKLAEREAEPVAARFLGLGYHAFVCRYPVYVTASPAPGVTYPEVDPASHYPRQAVSLMRAIAYVRSHAKDHAIDPEHIYTLGFSAGGHVVGTVAERWDDPELLQLAETTASLTKPSGVIMCYPMVDAQLVHDTQARAATTPNGQLMATLQRRAIFGGDNPCQADFDRLDLTQHVRPDMPRTFVWQTAADDTLRVNDTVRFVHQLLVSGIDCEFHLFQRGIHGISLADTTTSSKPQDINPEAARWLELAAAWLALDGTPQLYPLEP